MAAESTQKPAIAAALKRRRTLTDRWLAGIR
jgi:hypothetical protein